MAPIPTYEIRSATVNDIPFLAAIERSAGQLFQTVGLDSLADDDPMPPEVLRSYCEKGNLWVAVVDDDDDGRSEAESRGEREKEDGQGVAFLAAFPVTVTGKGPAGSQRLRPRPNDLEEGSTETGSQGVLVHIAELSVHADHHRRGLGKRLMQHFEESVTSRQPSTSEDVVLGLSLTTYRDVPFNGPFYARFGFKEVPAADIEKVVGKRGKELWDEEQQKIASPERRMWAVKWVDSSQGVS